MVASLVALGSLLVSAVILFHAANGVRYCKYKDKKESYKHIIRNKRIFDTMLQNTYQLPLTFEQILTLVKQLSDSEKLLLSKELEKETLNKKLSQLLETFQTDELSLEEITEEVENVRSQIYARKQSNQDNY
ncbi:type II toxin-antitoxin system VapB15 family antitoxin [Anabaena sp. FACHB-709]|uniref:Uncharacterized protein n=2 Tax=Nostocaceae TaxID=1162 RepID=A0A1Z4KGE5_ANAVA|nr:MULTISPECIES: hypothetical protein [Nostocaceae]RUR89124.1 hypothetical protein DSM107007_05750 [Nostoc sp. PCC 7120 = FACHB-418]BAB74121.1 all2422 [Nostoc sp. PCC 7120 = FACHB-418]BAY68042.1 hypothetical protein NIES23_08250 [Trichormus variabilis NIES-23]